MCKLLKYCISFIIAFIVVFIILGCFAYGDESEKEYVKKRYSIIVYNKNGTQYISETKVINNKQYEVFNVYDNNTPIILKIPKNNVKSIKNDTITEKNLYIEYVSQYKIKSKLKSIFNDDCYINMLRDQTYAIIYIPNNYTFK